MKTIIKLVLVLAILNGVVHVGLAAASYYQFKDESLQLVTFGGRATPGELQNRILERATALQLPVVFEDIMVTRDGFRTTAQASYTQPVEVFPNYTYPISFKFTVEGIDMGGDGRSHAR
jgi:hypothetical protein